MKTVQNPLIAYCGLDCANCDARRATVSGDETLRVRTAQCWSELNHVPITPEMINCLGCRTVGPKTVYCESMCPIRQCARSRELETCGDCPEMECCSKLAPIRDSNPEARANLNPSR